MKLWLLEASKDSANYWNGKSFFLKTVEKWLLEDQIKIGLIKISQKDKVEKKTMKSGMRWPWVRPGWQIYEIFSGLKIYVIIACVWISLI